MSWDGRYVRGQAPEPCTNSAQWIARKIWMGMKLTVYAILFAYIYFNYLAK